MPSFCSVYKCAMRGTRDKVSFFQLAAILTKLGQPSVLEEYMHPDWIPSQNMGYQMSLQLQAMRDLKEENSQVIPTPNEVGTAFQVKTETMNTENVAQEKSSMEVHENSFSVSV